MKVKCRILSMCVVVVLAIALISGIFITINKNKDKDIYAKSLKFSGLIGGVEIYIENELIIDDNLVTVSPANCSFKPEFSIKKSGDDESVAVDKGKFLFETNGKYTLSCRVKSSKNYYLIRSISITVVDVPTDDTNIYVKKLTDATMYVEDKIDLLSVAEIKCPNSVKLDLICNENISIENNIVTAIKEGLGQIDIVVRYNNISICKTIFIIVKPKLTKDNIELKLTIGGQAINNNIEIEYSEFNFMMNYELTNLEGNQSINCWTDSNIVSIVSYNSPIIEMLMIDKGKAVVYVSPLSYPEIVFEIVINII